jgi:hypothetical protein
LANRSLCWAAKIGRFDRPGKTITFNGVWAAVALMVPNIAAPASVAVMRVRIDRIVGPPG